MTGAQPQSGPPPVVDLAVDGALLAWTAWLDEEGAVLLHRFHQAIGRRAWCLTLRSDLAGSEPQRDDVIGVAAGLGEMCEAMRAGEIRRAVIASHRALSGAIRLARERPELEHDFEILDWSHAPMIPAAAALRPVWDQLWRVARSAARVVPGPILWSEGEA